MVRLRIAVLECDTPPENANSKYGGYRGIFASLLRESARTLAEPERLNPGTDLDITGWDVVGREEYPRFDDIDAILLTGSKHNSFDDVPWVNRLVEYTREAIAHDRVRVLGVCFGHQIIGRALGAKVGRNDDGWEISVCEVNLTTQGKELFGLDKMYVQQMHRDVVYEYPPHVVPLGSSSACTVQGMYSPGHFITVQGHPEFNADIISEIVSLRAGTGIFSKEQSSDALNRAGRPHDGLTVGMAFLKFLMQGKE